MAINFLFAQNIVNNVNTYYALCDMITALEADPSVAAFLAPLNGKTIYVTQGLWHGSGSTASNGTWFSTSSANNPAQQFTVPSATTQFFGAYTVDANGQKHTGPAFTYDPHAAGFVDFTNAGLHSMSDIFEVTDTEGNHHHETVQRAFFHELAHAVSPSVNTTSWQIQGPPDATGFKPDIVTVAESIAIDAENLIYAPAFGEFTRVGHGAVTHRTGDPALSFLDSTNVHFVAPGSADYAGNAVARMSGTDPNGNIVSKIYGNSAFNIPADTDAGVTTYSVNNFIAISLEGHGQGSIVDQHGQETLSTVSAMLGMATPTGMVQPTSEWVTSEIDYLKHAADQIIVDSPQKQELKNQLTGLDVSNIPSLIGLTAETTETDNERIGPYKNDPGHMNTGGSKSSQLFLQALDGGSWVVGASGSKDSSIRLDYSGRTDYLKGSDNSDVLIAGNGQANNAYNILDGGKQNDFLVGGSANDKLLGGDGNDVFFQSAGADIVDGGSGKNIFVVSNDLGAVTITMSQTTPGEATVTAGGQTTTVKNVQIFVGGSQDTTFIGNGHTVFIAGTGQYHTTILPGDLVIGNPQSQAGGDINLLPGKDGSHDYALLDLGKNDRVKVNGVPFNGSTHVSTTLGEGYDDNHDVPGASGVYTQASSSWGLKIPEAKLYDGERTDGWHFHYWGTAAAPDESPVPMDYKDAVYETSTADGSSGIVHLIDQTTNPDGSVTVHAQYDIAITGWQQGYGGMTFLENNLARDAAGMPIIADGLIGPHSSVNTGTPADGLGSSLDPGAYKLAGQQVTAGGTFAPGSAEWSARGSDDAASHMIDDLLTKLFAADDSGAGVPTPPQVAQNDVPLPDFPDDYSQLAAASTLQGNSGANLLAPGGHYLAVDGLGGGDTIVFNRGDGNVIVTEADSAVSPMNVLQFGAGISTSEVSVTGSGGGDIVLYFGNDSVTLVKALQSTGATTYGVQEVQFTDGTTWTYADLLQKVSSSDLNWAVYGDSGANVLDTHGTGGAAVGNGGGDTFVYHQGYGSVTITEKDVAAASNLLTIAAVDPAAVSVHGQGTADIVLDMGNGDQVTLVDALRSDTAASYGVQQIQFDDGTNWSYSDLLSHLAPNSSGALYGDRTANVLDPGGSADSVFGNGGGDTIIYHQGYGAVLVDEQDPSSSATNALAFGTGIDPSQLAVHGTDDGSIVIDLGAGDVVTLAGALLGTADMHRGVQEVTFADGTTWTAADLVEKAGTASASSPTIYGDTSANVLDPAGLATNVVGNGGGDSLVFNQGYGAVTFLETDLQPSPHNAITLGDGILPTDVTVEGAADGSIVLGLGGSDSITLTKALLSDFGTTYGVQQVNFSDGTIWSYADLLAKVETPTDGSSISGDRGANVLDPQGLASLVIGWGGGDTIIYDRGYGMVTVNEADIGPSPSNSLHFADGIATSDVTVTADGSGDLILSLGGADEVVITGMLNASLFGPLGHAGVQTVAFADGTTWSAADLLEMASESGSTLFGDGTANLLDPGGTKSLVAGGGGGDTIVYDAGYGALEIDERDASWSTNTLQLGSGIDPANVSVHGTSGGSLILDFGGGDTITIDAALLSTDTIQTGIQQVEFADGTTWSAWDLMQRLSTASSDNTILYGNSWSNWLSANGYATAMYGFGGGFDTFQVMPGDPDLTIYEEDRVPNPSNGLNLSFNSDQVSVSATGSGDVILSVDGGPHVTLAGELNSANGVSYGVQSVAFADGTIWTYADLLAKVDTASATNLSLLGDFGPNVLDPAGMATSVTGRGGGDTILYDRGYGAIRIDEEDTGADPANALQFGADILPSDVAVTQTIAGDYVLSLGGNDIITITGAMLDEPGVTHGVQSVRFADGTIWTSADLLSHALTTPQPGGTLIGDAGANILDTQGIATAAVGNGGGDTFIYGIGYGAVTIDEKDAAENPANVLAFGTGISPADVAVSASPAGDLVLTLAGGDSVTLTGALLGSADLARGVQTITFADGTTWTYAALVQSLETPAAGHDVIAGDASSNILNPAGIAHTIMGFGGGDTIVFDQGYGAVVVDERDASGHAANILQFGGGIVPAGVTVTATADGDLLLDAGGGDQVTLRGALQSTGDTENGVQEVLFADGTIWSYSDLLQSVMTPSSSQTTLYGDSSANILDGQGMADVLVGNGGGDTFVFQQGYGLLTIDETDKPGTIGNTLQLGVGISPASAVVTGDGLGNLVLDLGGTDQIVITGALAGDDETLRGVQQIVFADGTVWTDADLLQKALTPSAVNTTLHGDRFANDFDPQGIAHAIQGGGGGDVIHYEQGYGLLSIDEQDSAGGQNVLAFGSSVVPGSVTVTADGSGNIVLDLGGGDVVTLLGADGPDGSVQHGVETVSFANGSSWSLGDLRAFAAGAWQVAAGETVNIDEATRPGQGASPVDLPFASTAATITLSEDGSTLTVTDGSGTAAVIHAVMIAGIGADQTIHYSDGVTQTLAQALHDATAPDSLGYIVGTAGPEEFSFTPGVKMILGGGGGDAFAYNVGNGAVSIWETDTAAAPSNQLTFGSGITAASLSVRSNGADLILDLGDGDKVTITNALLSTSSLHYGVQQVNFADGSSLTYEQLLALADTGRPDNAGFLYGDAGANIFDPAGYSHLLMMQGGSDTILYNSGYGDLSIDDTDQEPGATAAIVFGPGIAVSDVTILGPTSYQYGASDVRLQLPDGTITIGYALSSHHPIISELNFADGGSLNYSDILQELGTPKVGVPIFGDGGSNSLDTQGISHVAVGYGGGDTFVYNAGYGALAVYESDESQTPANALSFGSGITQDQVSLTASGDDVIVTLPGSDVITLKGQLAPAGSDGLSGVQSIEFADGSSWSRSEIGDRITATHVAGTSGDDIFTATASAEIFTIGGGHDQVDGFQVSGSQHDYLQVSRAQFADWNALSAAFSSHNGDLLVTLDSSHSLLLSNVSPASLTPNDVIFV